MLPSVCESFHLSAPRRTNALFVQGRIQPFSKEGAKKGQNRVLAVIYLYRGFIALSYILKGGANRILAPKSMILAPLLPPPPLDPPLISADATHLEGRLSVRDGRLSVGEGVPLGRGRPDVLCPPSEKYLPPPLPSLIAFPITKTVRHAIQVYLYDAYSS